MVDSKLFYRKKCCKVSFNEIEARVEEEVWSLAMPSISKMMEETWSFTKRNVQARRLLSSMTRSALFLWPLCEILHSLIWLKKTLSLRRSQRRMTSGQASFRKRTQSGQRFRPNLISHLRLRAEGVRHRRTKSRCLSASSMASRLVEARSHPT